MTNQEYIFKSAQHLGFVRAYVRKMTAYRLSSHINRNACYWALVEMQDAVDAIDNVIENIEGI